MGLRADFKTSEGTQTSILEKLGSKVVESGVFRNDFWITVKGDELLGVVQSLREDFHFTSFVDLCGVDYLGKKEPRFEVVTHLLNMEKNERIRIRVLVPDDTLKIPSITPIWSAANWQEREAFDMYGMTFEGHPNMIRILSAPNVKANPQRKDYPLHGEWHVEDEFE